MRKVYCKYCRYVNKYWYTCRSGLHDKDVLIPESFFQEEHVAKLFGNSDPRDCSEKNKYNTCPDFKEKVPWWKFWRYLSD